MTFAPNTNAAYLSELSRASEAEWDDITTPRFCRTIRNAPGTAVRPASSTSPAPKGPSVRKIVTNLYPGTCPLCSQRVEAGEGSRTGQPGAWVVSHLDGQCPAPAPKPVVEAPKAEVNWKRPVEIPSGEYAVENAEGVLQFYTVRNIDEGRWAGYTFVDVHSSDERYPLKGHARTFALQAIAADPRAAAVRYGHETNHCFRCGKELTDESSREAGIGPICSGKAGF
jgi:hypothetical protein